MKVMEKLVDVALDRAGDLTVEDYVVGLGLVGVKLSNGSMGVAYNLRSDMLGECEEFFKESDRGMEPPLKKGMKAVDFIGFAKSPDPTTKSLAMATINAVLNNGDYEGVDVLDVLDIGPDDVVGMVGNIKPFVFEVLQTARELRVFERNRRKEDTYPDWAITSMLGDCSVVIITASSVVNWTVEWILDYVRTDRVAIVGPSAPMIPGVFPVRVIGGAEITDPDKALEVLKLGGGTKSLYSSGSARKVSIVQG